MGRKDKEGGGAEFRKLNLLRKVGRLGLTGGVKLVMILRLCGCVELKRCGVGVDAKGV